MAMTESGALRHVCWDGACPYEESSLPVLRDDAYRYDRRNSLILCRCQEAICPQGLPSFPDPNGPSSSAALPNKIKY